MSKMPGSTQYFKGGMIIYSPDYLKDVGINESEFMEYGVASTYFVRKVAETMRKQKNVDICICASGFAGPGGSKQEIPIGSSYIALAIDTGTYTNHIILPGNRKMVQERCSLLALQMVRLIMDNKEPKIIPL